MISNLNQRASVLAPTLTPDGGGGYSESWNAIATVWCKLEPQSGDDVFGPDAVEQRLRHRVTIRRLATVAAGQRLVLGSRTLWIHAVLDDGPQAPLMTLLCEELP
jgi:SPP1 family predicted phage head-tail adaptor